MFQSTLKTARRLVGTWEPGAHLLTSLEGLPKRHWEDPVLRKILDNDEIDEETGKQFLCCSSELLSSCAVIVTISSRRLIVKSYIDAFYTVLSR